MIQRPEARTYQRRGRGYCCHEDVRRKSPEIPRDRAKFQNRNERSSNRRPQTGKKQQRKADGDHAYGDYLGGGAFVQLLNDLPD